jgi:hypothetical protein
MSEQIFENYDEAHKYSLTVPWKLKTCSAGEECWCRIIVPTEKILYEEDTKLTDEPSLFEYIIPDGSIDKETAEYVVDLHNRSVNLYRNQKKRLETLQELNDLDQELGFQ